MLFTAPSFLFLFLPAVMAIYALIPRHYRRYAILLFNLAYYVIAVWYTPESILLALLTSAFTYSAGFVIAVTHRRSTLLAAIAVDLIAFAIYRGAYDYASGSSYFPLGAAIYLLAAISYLIDIYRNDAPHAKNIADLLIYMLFFPTLIVGPIIRYKDFGAMLEKIDFSLENFAEGVKLYIAGFLKHIAIAAVLDYILARTAEVGEAAYSIPIILLNVLMLCAQAWFALTGYSDMARGLMYMLGIPSAADFQLTPLSRTPADFPRRFFVSLNRWVEDYLVYPILRVQFLSSRTRRVLAACVICLVPAIWVKSRLYILLPILPVLLWRCTHILRESCRHREPGKLGLAVGRACYWLLFLACFVGFWFTVSLDDAKTGADLIRKTLESATLEIPYAMYAVLSHLGYLIVGVVGLLCFLPLRPEAEQRIQALPRPISIVIRAAALAGVMICFAFSILHFLPQFPQYAISAFAHVVF